ncbi:MAG: UvrD-helicase domain-containing protein [Gammaproteobacteria bacterium]
MSEPVPDQAQRRRALDPAGSFIVQAPAGSGKTELLIQRYLVLLARVEHPEEILAITFTRKAAGEMRQRIVAALRAAEGEEPEEAHARETWRLAREARAADQRLGWSLSAHPGRLRIQTIDAFCAELTRQLPLLSEFGSPPGIADEASQLYREAARKTLGLLESGGELAEPVDRLARHLDNDQPYIEALLTDMLARRDHWLRHVAAGNPRSELEGALRRLVEERLARIGCLVPDFLREEVVELARYAAANCRLGGRDTPIRELAELRAWPKPKAEALPQWRGLAALLLTRGEWRKSATDAIGFPAPSKASGEEKLRRQGYKERFVALLSALSGEAALADALSEVEELAEGTYTDRQWEVLEALVRLLPVAAAQLKLVFQEHGTVDFTELGIAATRALGAPEAPTDLALALDYRLKHLLVDEFQDTSLRQYHLLELLTAGWERGDGRTLFVVGDPMQSIYRFREAEVALYLRARERGLPNVTLEPVTLSANFRSQAAIVEWVNEAFPQVFPSREDALRGGVPYSPAIAQHGGEAAGVTVRPLFEPEMEAQAVLEAITEARTSHPEGTIALLVRSRTHLHETLPRLREAGIRYQAVEIEPLGSRPVIQDLLALTRALIHPADRIAWLASLRAPWCGLTLADLTRIAGGDRQALIWERLLDPEVTGMLSDDGRTRVARFHAAMAMALAERGRRPLRRLIEGAWVSLGGPACLERESDLADAATFLRLVEELEAGADLPDLTRLTERVGQLYATPDTEGGEGLQVMTIHKAKGLEFDTVIVPGLGRRPGSESDPLLRWLEIPREGEPDDELLLAPIRARGDDPDPISLTLKQLDRERSDHEDGRLLYVAATRARRRLYLLGHCPVVVKEGDRRMGRPASGSLLAKLWPVVEPLYRRAFAESVPERTVQNEEEPGRDTLPLRRLPSGWQRPAAPSAVAYAGSPPTPEPDEEPLEFEWAGDVARQVGTAVHRLLQMIAEGGGCQRWPESRLPELRGRAEQLLIDQGVTEEVRADALNRVAEALRRTLSDERGRWLLDAGHQEGAVEWPLSGLDNGSLVHVVLDRTFVDSDGVRWIVDYKTGVHEGPDVEAFLDNEQHRYQPQLERYARLLSHREVRPIRLGLYFPLLGGWREWPYSS